MEYSAKNHAKFLILYHLIFVCKYRKKLLIRYGDETKRIFEDIATRSDFSFEARGASIRITFTVWSKASHASPRLPLCAN